MSVVAESLAGSLNRRAFEALDELGISAETTLTWFNSETTESLSKAVRSFQSAETFAHQLLMMVVFFSFFSFASLISERITTFGDTFDRSSRPERHLISEYSTDILAKL